LSLFSIIEGLVADCHWILVARKRFSGNQKAIVVISDKCFMKNGSTVRKVTQLFLEDLAKQSSILRFDLLQNESIRIV
jgi:hypothetical protein